MARRKDILNDKAQVEEQVVAQEQAEEVVNAEPVAEQPVEAEKKEVAKAPVEVTTNEIPAKAREILRIFNAYDSLYITTWGGVFPEGHLPGYIKDAVLYKNPFFKK